MPRPVLLLLPVALLGACGNPCQSVCTEMARYAEECGLTVSREDVLTCKETQADVSADAADACRDYNDPDALREWWSCDDLAENYRNGGDPPAR